MKLQKKTHHSHKSRAHKLRKTRNNKKQTIRKRRGGNNSRDDSNPFDPDISIIEPNENENENNISLSNEQIDENSYSIGPNDSFVEGMSENVSTFPNSLSMSNQVSQNTTNASSVSALSSNTTSNSFNDHSLHLSDLNISNTNDSINNDSQNTTREEDSDSDSDIESFGGKISKTKKNRAQYMRKAKSTKRTKITKRTKSTKRSKKTRKHKSRGIKRNKPRGKQNGGCYGTGVGANNYDPNYSIYNTNMLKLFPYTPMNI
jgi:hypothetical protein